MVINNIQKKNEKIMILSFFSYLIISYSPGLIFYPFFEKYYQSYYSLQEAPYIYFIINLFLFTIFFIISFGILSKLGYFSIPKFPSNIVFLLFCAVIIVYLISSIDFFLNYTSSFRHKSRLSDAGALVKAMFFFKHLINLFILMALIHVLNGNKLGKKTLILLGLVLVSSVLALNSSLQIVGIFIVLLLIFFPSIFKKKFKKMRWYSILSLLIMTPLLAVLVLFIGIGNKVGYPFLLSSEGANFLIDYIGFLVPRTSTSLFASATLTECCILEPRIGWETLENIVFTIQNRLSIFTGNSFDATSINTVNRANYLLVFQNHADRAGASPGILASLYYTPLYPLFIFLIPMLTAILLRSVAFNINKNIKFNLLTLIAITFLFSNFLEAPLNIFYIIDPMFFMYVVFISIRTINIDKVMSK